MEIAIKQIIIPLGEKKIVSLLFRRANDGDDWVCVMKDEFMTDLSNLLEVEEHTVQ